MRVSLPGFETQFYHLLIGMIPLYLSLLIYKVGIIIASTSWAVAGIKRANTCLVLRQVPGANSTPDLYLPTKWDSNSCPA